MILILLVDCSHSLLSGTAESEDARLRQQHGLDHPAVVVDFPSLECACDFSNDSYISSDREREYDASSQWDAKKFAEHEPPVTATPQSPSSFAGSEGADKNTRYHLLKSAAEDFWAESDVYYHKYRQVLVGGDEKRCARARVCECARENSDSGVGARLLHSLSPSMFPTSCFILFFSPLTVQNTGAF
jgi:hypothetical protein